MVSNIPGQVVRSAREENVLKQVVIIRSQVKFTKCTPSARYPAYMHDGI